jgi:hypothetical protein
MVVLKDPDYVQWMLTQSEPSGALARVRAEALRLMATFDAKALVAPCSGHGCRRLATRFSAYAGNTGLLNQWCDCDPYQTGAAPGKLRILHTYRQGLAHVEQRCGGLKSGYRKIIKLMAQAKGLPTRVGDQQAAAFFT